MTTLAYHLSGLSLLMGVLLVIRMKNPAGWLLMAPKSAAGALSPYLAVMGLAGAILGWESEAYWTIPAGLVGASMTILYYWRCTSDHPGFERAFGADLSLERDITFWKVPGTDRELLCDIWRPANGEVSGLAIIHFHGGGWWIGDKDFFTKQYFRHMVAQGHTVMDVAYRLCPEVDIYGMVGDV